MTARIPVAPLADYHRAVNRAVDAERRVTELLDELASRRGDEALAAQLQRTLVVMSRVGKMLSKHAPAADEREAFAEFFSLLAEHGCHPGQAEQERLELAFAEWEGRR